MKRNTLNAPKEPPMYVDTHVVASLVLIASILVITGVAFKLLRQAMKRDDETTR